MLRDLDKTPVTEHALPMRAIAALPVGWSTREGARGAEVAVPGMLDRLMFVLELRALQNTLSYERAHFDAWIRGLAA